MPSLKKKKIESIQNNCSIKGIHFTFDLYDCDLEEINSVEFLKSVFLDSTKIAKMEVLHEFFYNFEQQGITGVFVLSTSHISFHTWPEKNYIACDFFSCSDIESATEALRFVCKRITHKRSEVNLIRRGCLPTDLIAEYEEKSFNSAIFRNGEIEKIAYSEVLTNYQSEYQYIQVLNTNKFGKMLIIDGAIQSTENDHQIYDNKLLSLLRKNHKKLLILGGGDGFVAETALKIDPELQVTICEYDQAVIDCAKKYFKQEVFDQPNVNVLIGDAVKQLEYFTGNNEFFDYIVCDLTDEPIGSNDSLSVFYSNIFNLSKKVLCGNGVISVMAGVEEAIAPYTVIYHDLTRLLKASFGNAIHDTVFAPSYGENLVVLFSEKQELNRNN